MSRKSILTKSQEYEICQLYKDGNSIRKIAERFPVGRTRIGSILKKHKIETKSTGNPYRLRKYTVDEGYFNKIDTPEKAYWLGFILSDGHVSQDGVHIALSQKDHCHLEKFKECIGSSHNVKVVDVDYKYKGKLKSKKASRLDVYSKKMVENLRELGIESNKSLIVKPPKTKNIFKFHLIRGIFDGDGSISIRRGRLYISFCGSRDTMYYVRDNLAIDNVDVNQYNTSIWHLKINDLITQKKILEKIYKDADIYLQRKYDLYLSAKELNYSIVSHSKYDRDYLRKIKSIREDYDSGCKIFELANNYSMNYNTVSAIVHRKIWRNL